MEDIPVPQIKHVESYDKDVPDNYEIKKSYVRYHRPSEQQWKEQTIDYVADTEDETWLAENTKFGAACNQKDQTTTSGETPNNNENACAAAAAASTEDTVVPKDSSAIAKTPTVHQQRKPQLTIGIFELMMDILEKETGFDIIVASDQAENLIRKKIPQLSQLFPLKARAGVVTTKHVINDVYNYWVQKRSKLKRPLLRRYWPVTSTDDTNPHLVFRPREKEKYKLRKKRVDDMNSFRKMQQLRNDFNNLRLASDLVRRREQLNRSLVQMNCELFEQKIFELTDTSGKPRISPTLKKREMDDLFEAPSYFDVSAVANKKVKKGRRVSSRSVSPLPGSMKPEAESTTATAPTGGQSAAASATGSLVDAAPLVVAGQNFGEPAPGFLHPLATRETFVTSWDNAVPHVTSYVNAHPIPTYRFRHRPRVGRGGRLCIDRLPCPSHPETTPITMITAGNGLPRQAPGQPQKSHLLDLLPRPLDYKTVSRRIEDISLSALKEEIDMMTGALQGTVGPPGSAVEGDENDGDQVMVKLDDWLETDEQLWGEERFSVGPL